MGGILFKHNRRAYESAIYKQQIGRALATGGKEIRNTSDL